jgi:hypothetical protein
MRAPAISADDNGGASTKIQFDKNVFSVVQTMVGALDRDSTFRS